MTNTDREALEQMLDQLLENRSLDIGVLSEELGGIAERIGRLKLLIDQMTSYALKLVGGDLDVDPPPRANYLAGGLKQLQAQLRHLSWQAQCVADGDLSQHVDFMGDFSRSFNRMVKQLKQRETKIQEQRAIMSDIFDQIEGVVVLDEEDPARVLYINQHGRELFMLKDERVENTELLQQLLTQTAGESRCEWHVATGRWYGVSNYPLHWDDQTSARLYYFVDITAHKIREMDLERNAQTDALTGLGNRRLFDAMMEMRWEECRLAARPISVIVFDLDWFKRYNDTYGHPEGDRMLRRFAQVLKRCFGRREDVVARYGGEEFMALIPNATRENAVRMAERVRAAMAGEKISLTEAEGEVILAGITVSCGTSSVIPRLGIAWGDLLKAADAALYQAKENGRDQVCALSIEEWRESRNGSPDSEAGR